MQPKDRAVFSISKLPVVTTLGILVILASFLNTYIIIYIKRPFRFVVDSHNNPDNQKNTAANQVLNFDYKLIGLLFV